jgi:hypothetical protein
MLNEVKHLIFDRDSSPATQNDTISSTNFGDETLASHNLSPQSFLRKPLSRSSLKNRGS